MPFTPSPVPMTQSEANSTNRHVCLYMQVLRYGLGQQYKPHMDTIRDPVAGIRVATVLMYLNGKQSLPEQHVAVSCHVMHCLCWQR